MAKKHPLWKHPRNVKLILRIGKESESFIMPATEGAWVAKMITSIFTGDETRLFKIGDKVTFARYQSDKILIELKPTDEEEDHE